MAYIGNSPEVNAFTIGVERFNGTGACTEFTLTRDIDDAKAIEVIVNGVQQDPDNSYTVTNGLITFSEAPSVGTDNILVTYRAPVVVTFNQVGPTQIQPNAVTTTAIADGAITSSKFAGGGVTGDVLGPNAVSSNNIAPGAITGNLLAPNIITSNNIVDGGVLGNDIGIQSISANHISIGAITGNLIAPSAVSSNHIVVGGITGNVIGIQAISGNNLGIGSVSANNFAGGGITSNVLSSNLQISTSRVAETVNVVTTGIGGTYDIHLANSSVYYFVSNTTANVTFNFRANTQNILDSVISTGQTASVAIALKQGSTRYRVFATVDGVSHTTYWLGNTQPTLQTSQPQSIDSYNFTIIKIAANSYTIMAANSTYAMANGQI